MRLPARKKCSLPFFVSKTCTAPDVAQGAAQHGYALLYSTISDEARLDGLLIVKRISPSSTQLIKDIAAFAREGKSSLRKFAAQEPKIPLTDPALPQAESRTREAISSDTSKQLLGSSGSELELRLLLTQNEALNYISHMAAVVAKDEPLEDRRRTLTAISQDADALRQRVLKQLMSR